MDRPTERLKEGKMEKQKDRQIVSSDGVMERWKDGKMERWNDRNVERQKSRKAER
jgi:hypothetical protein